MPPKRKLPRTRTNTRYSTFRNAVVTRLESGAKLVACKLCGAQKMAHHLCATCGGYAQPKAPTSKSAKATS